MSTNSDRFSSEFLTQSSTRSNILRTLWHELVATPGSAIKLRLTRDSVFFSGLWRDCPVNFVPLAAISPLYHCGTARRHNYRISMGHIGFGLSFTYRGLSSRSIDGPSSLRATSECLYRRRLRGLEWVLELLYLSTDSRVVLVFGPLTVILANFDSEIRQDLLVDISSKQR